MAGLLQMEEAPGPSADIEAMRTFVSLHPGDRISRLRLGIMLFTREQFDEAGLRVLVESRQAGVHLATSADGLRFVFFQGHPEYDTVSLMKEYKREVLRYAAGELPDYPPMPDNYLKLRERSIFNEYRYRLQQALDNDLELPVFPEALVDRRLDNTWHDTAEAVVGNWIGLVYQVTHRDPRIPFMEGIDPDNPLGLSEI